MNELTMIGGILGLALILSVSIYAFAQLRIEQERTLQKLIDRGLSVDEILRSAGVRDRGSTDLRRGILLIAVGLSWSLPTFFAGGSAWMMGFVPIVIGACFILFRILDGGAR